MATLKIVMRGIALIADGNPGWEVYMPFAGCHRVNFKVEGESGDGINLDHPGQKLEISVSGAAPSMSSGTNYDQFFDINGPEAHADGVVLRDGWENGTTLISIPGGKYSAELSNGDYKIWRTDTTSDTTTIGKIGTVGMVEIDGEEISLTASGKENFNLKFTDNTTILIDNDCHGQIEGNATSFSDSGNKERSAIDGIDNNKDFQLIYQAVEDAKVAGRKFNVADPSGSSSLPCNSHRVTKLLR